MRRLRRLALVALAVVALGVPAPARADDVPDVPAEAQRARDAGRPVGGDALGRPGLVHDAPGAPPPPAYPAEAYVLADVDTGAVLVAKNAHARKLPASTIKTLTALAVAPRVPLSAAFTGTAEEANVDGTKVGVFPGEQYTADQCMTALLLSSANDCAVALARLGGGLPKVTGEMNRIARSLGALDTVAKNTSGLDADGQVTSAYDLALIGRAAVRDADVAPYLVKKTAEFPGARAAPGGKRAVYQISSHNRLLWNYEGTLGVKNGYTNAARHTNIGVVRRGDKAYVFAFVGGASNGWRENATMFDWAFANGTKARGVGTLVEPARPAPDDPGSAAAQVSAAGSRAATVAAAASDRLGVDPHLLGGGAAALLLVGGGTALRLRARRR